METQDKFLQVRAPKAGLCLGITAKPSVMGILNVTPDSFSDGGRYQEVSAALFRTEQMLKEGAAIIDIGAASSRPKGVVYGKGALLITAEEEKKRLLPVVEAITLRFPEAILSIDTFRSDVAGAAMEVGADILNDITALRFDPEMASVAARYEAPLILMHSVGLPGEMPHAGENPHLVQDICSALGLAVAQSRKAGVTQIITDPGFGFGKSHSENLALIKGIPALLALGTPVMVGVSRKSTIGTLLNPSGAPLPPEKRLFGALGVTAIALYQGAKLVRTHDVGETVQFIELMYATMFA
ncbi:MAG TPA: dihydropteroate synthase [Rhodothermales bacterium]|nr:dihydropteroate synthase [Rhodothermales bacterium]HRR09637.1 dihydropteroate synthase [Rhodothermales bacterium]